MNKIKQWGAVLLAGLAFGAQAEVAEQSDSHFVVKHSFSSPKSAEHVYKHFLQINRWWEPDHTFSGKAENLHIDLKKHRCFCETMPKGGFVRHMEIVHVQPENRVVMTGGLGPLQDQAVNGAMIWTFEETDKGTKVNLEYRVNGFIVGGMGKWPAAVDFVLGTQIKRLEGLTR